MSGLGGTAARLQAKAEAYLDLDALRPGPGMALVSDTPSIRYCGSDRQHAWLAARRGPNGPEMVRFPSLARAFAFTEAAW